MGGEGRVGVPVRLSGGAYAVYQQLSEEKRADFACIKDVLYTAFALSPVTAYKQFAVRRLRLGEMVDVYLRSYASLQLSSEVWRSQVWSAHSLLGCRSMRRIFFRPLPK